jgi:hypothetical protein
MLDPGQLFDAFALLAKLIQKEILFDGKPVHPPKTHPQQTVPVRVIQEARLFLSITNHGTIKIFFVAAEVTRLIIFDLRYTRSA